MSAGPSTAPSTTPIPPIPSPTSTLRPRLEKRCLGCGLADGEVRPGTSEVVAWSNPRKLRCDRCDAKSEQATGEYHRKYHLGRSRAAQKLVNRHRDEFSILFAEALEAIEAEERKVEEMVAGGMDRKTAEKIMKAARAEVDKAEAGVGDDGDADPEEALAS